MLIDPTSGVFKGRQKVGGYGVINQQTGSHSKRSRLSSSINRGRPKFSNLNCGEMVCNDVKYCPEKDADSYYGRAGSEPFNLKPPGPGACKKMLTRQFHCQSVTRESIFAHAFFLSFFAFSLATTVA